MRKQKLVKVLALFTMSAAAISCAAAIGCSKPGSKPHKHTYAEEYSSDETGHWYAATCGHDAKKDFEAHDYDGDDDDDCSVCNYVRHEYASEWKYNLDGHWHVCNYTGCEEIQYSEHDFNDKGICKDCEKQFAKYELIPSDLEAKQYGTAYTSGIFTILAGTKVRTRSRENYNVYDWANGQGTSKDTPVEKGFTASKSVQYDGDPKGISVNAIAPGKLTIYIDNGTTGKTKTDTQSILLTRPNNSTQVINYYCGDIYAITIDCDVAGTYSITRPKGAGTSDIYYAKFETIVDVTPIKSMNIVNKGKVEFFKGQEFDYSGLQLEVSHEVTDITEPLDLNAEGLTIDYSDFNGNAAGTYTINISYSVDGKKFDLSYDVTVYDVAELQLGFNKIVQGSNSTAGNGQYINHTVKQFYFKDEQLSLDGLTVSILNDDNLKTVITDGYEVSGFVAGQAGKQTVRVYWKENPAIYQEFDVYVANYTAASITANQQITVNVSGNLEDNKVGVLENGAYQFKTIQQSLDFLNALTLDKNVNKVINLAAGTYWERLEINIPNLTIKGADSAHPENTIIEYDSLVGIADEGGFVHITDSTATLNVRDKAVGFVIEGVTISNWYNSEAHFTEKLGANYPEHRALAALIQADKVVIDNCRLLGYQDTIELFTGRQVVQNSYICGRTDFIFGTNNTTYFKDCEIESIVDGGYVTAFKGCNKGDGDWVQYGAIFDGCNFTAPSAVINKKDTSLGRTWGAYAAVAYVNCDFAGHISKTPYGSKGSRYTAMSGNEPTDKTVKFVEYNNTGAGAVSTTIAGMTYLSESDAAKYTDLSVIFGKTNGKVTYSDVWDGAKGVEITTVEYRFSDYYTATDSYKYHAIPAGGEDILGGLATVTGTNWGHELNQSKDQAKFDEGCVIQLKTAGEVYVTTYGAPYGAPENVKIVYVNGVATIYIVATEAQPINSGCYITLITLNTKVNPAHEHYYGDWSVTSTPSETGTGTAERTCQKCEEATAHVDSVTLPVLSEENYNIAPGTTSGNSKYTLKTNGEISFEAATLAGMHVHNYGNWVYVESGSKVTKTCTGEGTCDEEVIEVTVPALTDSRYTITNNTATLTAAGTGTYTIEIDGQTISFTAATPQFELTEIAANTNYYFKDGSSYAQTINAGETANYNGLIISGNTGSFKYNGANPGNWYVIDGDATLQLKIKSGTQVQVVIGFCQDCLSFAFDGTAVSEGTTALQKSAYASSTQTYTFTASADGVLSISKTAGAGTTYIGYIYVTV